MTISAATFLMFEGRAEEALTFYVSVVPGSSLTSINRHGADGPGPEGSVMLAQAVIAGMPVMASDSFVKHDFSFTPSVSLFLTCSDEAEIERLAVEFSDGGQFLMPLSDYGFSRRFGWLNDRFGVSWQLNLP
jgi:predicted 3-demethylubiquinone-9 3-methyltransferase (glyoxalase superfamily)